MAATATGSSSGSVSALVSFITAPSDSSSLSESAAGMKSTLSALGLFQDKKADNVDFIPVADSNKDEESLGAVINDTNADRTNDKPVAIISLGPFCPETLSCLFSLFHHCWMRLIGCCWLSSIPMTICATST